MNRQILFFCLLMQFCFTAVTVGAIEENEQQSENRFPEFMAPPFEKFSAMVQRPLFLSSRRPVSLIKPAPIRRPTQKKALVEKKINLSLSGVINDGVEYIALVRKGNNGDLVQLKKQQTIDGWRLVQIKPEEITLNKGANFTTVRLRDNKPTITDKRKAQRASKIRAEKLRKARLKRSKNKTSRRSVNRKK